MGLMSFLGGGSKSKSQSTQDSYNRAYDPVNTAFSPLLGYAQQGAQGLTDFLGGNTTGFDNYKRGTGFDFLLGRGLDGVNAAQAGRRMFNSGATAKGLQEFGSNLSNTYADNYMQRLLSLAGIGTSAASALTGAGSVSKGQSTSTSKTSPGLLKILSSLPIPA